MERQECKPKPVRGCLSGSQNLHLPLEFSDERLSSSEAKRVLREEGLSEKQMRGKLI